MNRDIKREKKGKNEKNEKELEEKTIIFEKEDFQFFKNNSKYCCTFSMINNNIHLPSIINFELLKIIHTLNPDISETIEFEKISDNEVNCLIVVKNLFQDLGLPQKYSYLNMKKIFIDNKTILFHAVPIFTEIPQNLPANSESTNIHSIKCICDIITSHEIKFTFDIYLQENFYVAPFLEKMIGLIIHKLFKRVKQFIENVVI
jgi:hypothetical protein